MDLQQFKLAIPKYTAKTMKILEGQTDLKEIMKDVHASDFKEFIIDYVKSTTLFTGGHVAAVRNPESYNANEAGKWSQIFGKSRGSVGEALFNHFPDSWTEQPEKEDYEKSRLLMLYLSKEPVYEVKYPALYRGLNTVPPNVFLDLCRPGAEYSIGDIVSASTQQAVAGYFSNDGFRYKIIYLISNPKGLGSPIHNASIYSHESEVVIGGKIKITGFKFAPDLSDARGIAKLGQSKVNSDLAEIMERIEKSKLIKDFDQLITFVQDIETLADYGVSKNYPKDYIQVGFAYVEAELL